MACRLEIAFCRRVAPYGEKEKMITKEEALKKVYCEVPTIEVHDLVVNFKESKTLYLIRKETGMRYKDFRLLIKHYLEKGVY